MPRLNGHININGARHSTNGPISLSDTVSKNVTFFGMVGAVMTALSLKDRWDKYQKVPTDPAAPPAYRDNSGEENDIGLDNPLDTEIPGARPTTRRPKGCCVCCGINCALFWKAFGIVLLLVTIWNVFKLAKWAMTPSPTGLEDMPEYSKALGCLDATHWYQDREETYYSMQVGSVAGDHTFDISGGAVGTLLIAPSTTQEERLVKVQASVRTNEQSLLQNVIITSAPLNDDSSDASFFSISTPSESAGDKACMRFDLTLFVPPNLKRLAITGRSVTHLKFSDSFASSPRSLSSLSISLSGASSTNLILPTADLSADNLELESHGGYVVGTAAIVNSTTIKTRPGTAISNLHLKTAPYTSSSTDSAGLSTAYLQTLTGFGRSDFTYENSEGRPVHSVHEARGPGDLYLTYKNAGFNGMVDLQAKSYMGRNMQGSMTGPPGTKQDHWVGDKDGGDWLKVLSTGWVGLYF